MNDYDSFIFTNKIKKIKTKTDVINNSVNEYRGIDVSEYPDFMRKMKKHRKRFFDLLKVLLQSSRNTHASNDETREMTHKFIEFAYDVFEHFEDRDKFKEVSERFNIVSSIDKILLTKPTGTITTND